MPKPDTLHDVSEYHPALLAGAAGVRLAHLSSAVAYFNQVALNAGIIADAEQQVAAAFTSVEHTVERLAQQAASGLHVDAIRNDLAAIYDEQEGKVDA